MFWKICRVLSIPFSLLPAFLFSFLWRILDVFDGRFGALLRYILICNRLASCGDKVYWGAFISIDDPSNICVGSNVSVHQGVSFLSKGGVIIGNNVAIAHGVSIVTGNHSWANPDVPIKYNPVELSSVRLSDDVWVGCGARLLAGVCVGTRSIIAAGAVVLGDVESYSVYGGVPAKKLKEI